MKKLMEIKSNYVVKVFVIVAIFVATMSSSDMVAAKVPDSLFGRNTQPVTSVNAQTIPASSVKVVTLNDIGYSTDETVQGVTVTRTFGMRWPGTWTILSGSSVTIDFSHPQNLASYSSMAVDFNDVRIGSVMLTPDNVDHGKAEFSIPANLIKVGYNALTLQFYMGIHDNYCEDLDNPGVWATIHNSSFFTLSYDIARPTPDLAQYPFPFLTRSEFITNQVTIVTPDKPTIEELDAVAVISAKLGQLNTFYNLNIEVVPESRTATLGSIIGNTIYIGRADHLKILSSEEFPMVKKIGSAISFVALNGDQLAQDDGVLWIDVSPTDAYSVRLFVTGQTDIALDKAARGLANDSVYTRLGGQLGIIQDVPAIVPATQTLQPTMTLEELGYEDETALGTVKQTINYVIPLPGEWQVATEAVLNLHFAHSELLYPQASVLTVLVNDTPVGSDMLTADNAEDGKLSYRIPARLFKIGSNTISVMTDIQLPYDPQDQYYCNKDHYNDAWVTVYSDSTLTLPSGPTSLILNLSNYPAGFTSADDLSDLAFVVPDSSDWETTQAVAWVAARLGRYSRSQELSPNVISSSQVGTTDKPFTSQIFIGRPSENPAIYQLNPILPLPFVEGQDTLQNPEKVAQIVSPTGSDSVGYVQSALTENGEPRLVVSGNSSDGVLWAARALNDQITVDQLKGDVVILNSQDSIYTASLKQQTASPINVIPTPTSGAPGDNFVANSTSWILWIAGGLFLVTLIIILSLSLTTLRKK
jgi:hypothetical protein